MEKITQSRMDRGYYKYQEEFENAALEVLQSGWYILGKKLQTFEEEFAKYTGAKYCVGLASGLDALWIAFRLLNIGPGDEVIVQANTYIASVMGITMNGATPIFVEPDSDYRMDASTIESKITARTKAVLVVHLYGQAADMTTIAQICKKHQLKLVEDCAQSHGAKSDGKMTGTFGDIGCFSFYPSKNLGAFGDAGAIITNDDELARACKVFRNYGSQKRYYNEVEGTNSRLDEIQAALLSVRMKHIDETLEERRKIAYYYSSHIKNPGIILPRDGVNDCTMVWHQYVIRLIGDKAEQNRDDLKQYLEEKGIGTLIHYPIPPHLSEAYERLGHKEGDYPITESFSKTILSLPIYSGMTEDEMKYVCDCINDFNE